MEEQDPVSILHNIFIEFFGEENVDFQEQTILIHFPKVKVTNENNRSVDITHLWVRVKYSLDGTINGGFQMMRSEFTDVQFACGYSHSHINVVSAHNFNNWATPCLGSGPMRNTISSLSTQFSEDIWKLFCLELSKYVTVESLSGVPYMYLEKIGKVDESAEKVKFPLKYFRGHYDKIDFNLYIRPFICFLINRKPFGFNFSNGSYSIAMSDKKLFITLSNLYIEFYNSLPPEEKRPKDELFSKGILRLGKCIDNSLYFIRDRRSTLSMYSNLIGRRLFDFKGKPVTFNITATETENDPNVSIFLGRPIVEIIIKIILTTINGEYGKSSSAPNLFGETSRYL